MLISEHDWPRIGDDFGVFLLVAVLDWLHNDDLIVKFGQLDVT